MKALVCVGVRDWEAVVRGAAGYLGEGDTITLVHVADGRAPRGYDLALRGLLGRRGRPASEEMSAASERAAEDLLADAASLLGSLRPGTEVRTAAALGDPGEELVRAAISGRADAVFVGSGSPGARQPVSVSGVVSGWKENRRGERDGLFLEDGTEVRFPPHRARHVGDVARVGGPVEAAGVQRGRHLHAFSVTDPASGASVEAHEVPGKGPGDEHLGRTARFVVDHVPCDAVVLRPATVRPGPRAR